MSALAVRRRALSSSATWTSCRELDRIFEGRTVIVVSSRVSAVRNADQIIVLDEGRIVERGSHAELMLYGALYRRLEREQAAAEARRAAVAATGGGA